MSEEEPIRQPKPTREPFGWHFWLLLAFCPIIPGTDRFDPKPFDGQAIFLRTDNSVISMRIGKDGHIYDDKGIDILSPENPIWDGQAPDIRYPDL